LNITSSAGLDFQEFKTQKDQPPMLHSKHCLLLVAFLFSLTTTALDVHAEEATSRPADSSEAPVVAELTAEEAAIAAELNIDEKLLAELKAKPLYEFTEAEVHMYLGFLQKAEPDLRKRIVMLGRKNLGQPYELYLLGEAPFEFYDPQPLYCLDRSDCVVFSEHTYAMALSSDWPSFFATLQRIRYIDGEIGVATRNHYTLAQWNRNNNWLVDDITNIVGEENVISFKQKINLSSFLKRRYKLDREIEPFGIEDHFLPHENFHLIKDKLQDGDFVNIIRGNKGGYWAGHVGLVALNDDGEPHFLHSTPPAVREESFEAYIARGVAKNEENKKAGKAQFFGFKFHRFQESALDNLKAIDGPEAPVVRKPDEAKLVSATTN
jgi:hypothetical protein